MSDSSISFQRAGLIDNKTKTYEANSRPLETSYPLLPNLDSGNDFSVRVNLPSLPEGTNLYLTPDSIDAIKLDVQHFINHAERNAAMRGEAGDARLTVNVNGTAYQVPARELMAALQGRGALTAGM